MSTNLLRLFIAGLGTVVLAIGVAACQTTPGPGAGTLEIPSGREPNAA